MDWLISGTLLNFEYYIYVFWHIYIYYYTPLVLCIYQMYVGSKAFLYSEWRILKVLHEFCSQKMKHTVTLDMFIILKCTHIQLWLATVSTHCTKSYSQFLVFLSRTQRCLPLRSTCCGSYSLRSLFEHNLYSLSNNKMLDQTRITSLTMYE